MIAADAQGNSPRRLMPAGLSVAVHQISGPFARNKRRPHELQRCQR